MTKTQEERDKREAEEYASAPRCAQVTPDDKAWHRLKGAYLAGLRAERARWKEAEEALEAIKSIVNEQALDEALWSVPWDGSQPIAEAHLQQELRKLHKVCEDSIARAALSRVRGEEG